MRCSKRFLAVPQVISDDTLAGFKKRNPSEGEGSVSDGGPDGRPHYLRPTSAGAGRVASPVNGRSNRWGQQVTMWQ